MKSKTAPGVLDGRLANCPASPNCISTEYPDDADHFSEPIAMPVNAQTADLVERVASAMGGTLHAREENYLAFTFTSRIFRFVDDFEVRLVPDSNTVHVRSASRVGHSDLGVNRKRVERFKAALQAAQ